MLRKPTTLPLFEKNKHNCPTVEARQGNDTANDHELSLTRTGSTRKTWGKTAGKMLLKARASVDALRRVHSHQTTDEENQMQPQMHTNVDDFSRASSPCTPPRTSPRGLASASLRATASLNRVLDTARHGPRRGSLFSTTGLSNASDTSGSPKGPEEYEDDSASSTHSCKRLSFSSMRGLTRTKRPGKPSSNTSSPLSNFVQDSDFDKAVRPSGETIPRNSTATLVSPTEVSNCSPPPSIHFDLSSTQFLDTELLEAVGLNEVDFAAAMSAILEKSSLEPSDQVVDIDPPRQVYMPSRNTVDHWRTSQGRLSAPMHAQRHKGRVTSGPFSSSPTTESILDLDTLLQQSGKSESTILGDDKETHDPPSMWLPLDLSSADVIFEDSNLSFSEARVKVSPQKHRESAEPSAEQSGRPRPAASHEPQTPPRAVQRASHISVTPSPEKTFELPLRLKLPMLVSKAAAKDAPPASPKVSLRKRKQQTSDRVSDEELCNADTDSCSEWSDRSKSPLQTQNMFYDSDEEDSGAILLELNDLLEKSSRKGTIKTSPLARQVLSVMTCHIEKSRAGRRKHDTTTCKVCSGTANHICECVSPSEFATTPTKVKDVEYQASAYPKIPELAALYASICAQARRPTDSASLENSLADLQRKKSDPVGLGLHRLGSEWLQGGSPTGTRRSKRVNDAGKLKYKTVEAYAELDECKRGVEEEESVDTWAFNGL